MKYPALFLLFDRDKMLERWRCLTPVMLKWLGPKRVQEENGGMVAGQEEEVTDDPLAAIDLTRREKVIYAVSRWNKRNAHLNVVVKTFFGKNFRINPLYDYAGIKTAVQEPPQAVQKAAVSGEKSNSSGYGGSNNDPLDFLTPTKKASASGSSGTGTLNTIPEGKIEDFTIPRPIWPYCKSGGRLKREEKSYDSLVDETLLLYTSLSFRPDSLEEGEEKQISIREVLLEMVHGINATIEGKTGLTPEEMLRLVNEKLSQSVEALKENSEKEVKNLCVNLSNCKKVNSVMRAFSHSGNSSPEWNGRSSSVETAYEIYHSPSGSSSSGFSDSQDLSGVRNAMIYGTLCRSKLVVRDKGVVVSPKKSLSLMNDGKPSVWEQYYGVNTGAERGEVKYVVKPTDVPLFVSISLCVFEKSNECTFLHGAFVWAATGWPRHFHFQRRLHGPLSYIQGPGMVLCKINSKVNSGFVVTV